MASKKKQATTEATDNTVPQLTNEQKQIKQMAEEAMKTGNLQQGLDLFDMNLHILPLLDSEPFFSAISRHVSKTPSLSIPTAGVRVNSEGHYEMLYNPFFFAMYDKKKRLGVLKHEFYHLILEHVTTRLPEGGMNRLWNIATDLAINSHIPDEIPEIGCIPGKGMFANLPPMKTAEWYYSELLKIAKENKEKGEGDGSGEELGDSLDDHNHWGENDNVDPTVKELAKQRIKEIMKEAAEEANKKNWGSVSEEMRGEIMDRISNKVDWRNVLRYAIKASRRANKQSTVKRLNKRYPMIHPGKKVERVANVAISIDQSGSVSDEMLSKFFAELNGLAKLATFTVIPFDTEVDESKVYVWKKGKHEKAKRVLCGGTDFSSPTKYVNEHNFELHVVLTDMCAPKPIASKCPRLWMTPKECASNPYFVTNERVVTVE
jgi:predicted metal-dependent peptidase